MPPLLHRCPDHVFFSLEDDGDDMFGGMEMEGGDGGDAGDGAWEPTSQQCLN